MGVRFYSGRPDPDEPEIAAATAIARAAIDSAAAAAIGRGIERGSIIVLVHVPDTTGGDSAALAGNFEAAPLADENVCDVEGMLHAITEHVQAIQQASGVNMIAVLPNPLRGEG